MSHLLHIDSSINGERSVSRRLTGQAAERWRAAHPRGTVTYRDLGSDPIPHIHAQSWLAGTTPAEQRTAEQAASWAVTERIIDEIKAADTILLGMPLYNYSAPSSVKAWVDHLIAPGHSFDTLTQEGLLGGREFIVITTRGGGYGEGTPRHGWDHSLAWLTHGVALAGLEPRFITAELTLAPVNPGMKHLIPLAEKSLTAAEREIDDDLWSVIRA